MASITVRNLQAKENLRVHAAKEVQSLEAYDHNLLEQESHEGEIPDESLGDIVDQLFAPENGVDLELPERRGMRPPPEFAP